MKVLLVLVLLLVLAASVGFVRLTRRLERIRAKEDARKAAHQNMLAEGGARAELDYIVSQVDEDLASGDDDPEALSRKGRLQELKTVLLKNHDAVMVPFDAIAASGEVVEAARRESPDRKIELSVTPGADAEVQGDPDLFRWAVRELFSNVRAHAGEWSRIAVGLEPSDEGVILTFVDDGDGPDLTVTSRLYGSFTPRVGSSGPGLGLFTVRAIVERMGGTIKARPGKEGGLAHAVLVPRNVSLPAENPRSDVASAG